MRGLRARFAGMSRQRAVVLAFALGLPLGGLAGVGEAQATPVASSWTFSTANTCTPWVAPAGVDTVQIRAVGAAGQSVGGSGGTGDGVTAILSGLSTGQVLDVCADYGGATGGTGYFGAGGTGGGASGVSLGTDFGQPFVVAGGGGGSGGNNQQSGGSAGQTVGGSGSLALGACNDISVATGGNNLLGTPGAGGKTACGQGGWGQATTNTGPGEGGPGQGAMYFGAGGGGAGYFGGGGGASAIAIGGSGAGGTDYCAGPSVSGPTLTNCAYQAGAGTDNNAGPASNQAHVTITVVRTLTVSLALTAPYTGGTGSQISNNGTSLGTATASTPLQVGLPLGTPLSLTADPVLLASSGSNTEILTGFTPVLSGSMSGNASTTASYTTIESELLNSRATGFLGTNTTKQQTYVQLSGQWNSAETVIRQPYAATTTRLSAIKTFACSVASDQRSGTITSGLGSELETDAGLVYRAVGGSYPGQTLC